MRGIALLLPSFEHLLLWGLALRLCECASILLLLVSVKLLFVPNDSKTTLTGVGIIPLVLPEGLALFYVSFPF